MPELPEIEVLRRSLAPRLVGEAIVRTEVRDPRLRERVRPRELAELAGQTVRSVGRRGKYLLIHLDGGLDGEREARTLVVHLGMSGRLTLAAGSAPDEPHEHVAIYLRSGAKLRLRDPRRFGLLRVVATDRLARDPHFAGLGLEPLAPEAAEDLTGAALREAAHSRRGPVKSFLMDAGVVVGVGNIYATEALFRAGVHPLRSVARLSPARWDLLAGAVVAVLRQAIGQGGTTLNDFADGEGRSGYFQVSLSAYGREGEPCLACGAAIRRIVQSGRSTFYCPRCQR